MKEPAESNTAFIQRVRAAHAKLSSDKHELEHDDIDACPLWYDGCNCVKAILSWLPGLTDRLEHAENRLAAIDNAVPGEVGEIRQRVDETIPPGGLTFREETQRKDIAILFAIVQRQAGEMSRLEGRYQQEAILCQRITEEGAAERFELKQGLDAARAEVERLKSERSSLTLENARLVNEHAAAMSRADVLAEGVRAYRTALRIADGWPAISMPQAHKEWEAEHGHMVSK